MDEDKDAFYDELPNQISKVRKHNMLIVISDFNAKVSNNKKWIERFLGQHGFGDLNQNGGRQKELCEVSNNMYSQHDFFITKKATKSP